MTRDEHLEWCKRRAREHLDAGEIANAVVSMLSDLKDHPDTEKSGNDPYLIMIGTMEAGNGDINGVRRWIEGFR